MFAAADKFSSRRSDAAEGDGKREKEEETDDEEEKQEQRTSHLDNNDDDDYDDIGLRLSCASRLMRAVELVSCRSSSCRDSLRPEIVLLGVKGGRR